MPLIPLLALAANATVAFMAVILIAVGFVAWLVIIAVGAVRDRAREAAAERKRAETRAFLHERWEESFPAVPYPDEFKEINYDPDNDAITAYELVLPHWEHPRNDGTRDARYSSTSYYYGGSEFVSGPWRVTFDSPREAVRFVQRMRVGGVEVTPHRWESEKACSDSSVASYGFPIMSADEVFAHYRSEPYRFEQFCVYLYRKLGYTGEATRRSGDGGFDFLVEKDGEKTIGECKLYGKNTTVGRPDVQKLVGANFTEGAEHMVFITTSYFTPEAKKFARDAGVEMVDGKGLRRLQIKAKEASARRYGNAVRLWKPLTEQDVIDRTPPDLRHTL